MDLKKINDIAYDLMGNRKAHNEREIGGIYYHGQRVANLAIEIRKQMGLNTSMYDDVMIAASYLHDIGKGIEPHARYGAVLAKEAIKDHVDEDEMSAICKMIKLHCDRKPNDNNYEDYIKIVQDADLIDHFGTYGIWVNINYAVHKNNMIHDLIDYYDREHSKIITKHRKLLNYEVSKNIFDERVAFEKQYIKRLKIEGKGGIFSNLREV